MKIVESFPHKVREIEHSWVPLADGCRLAARLWLPDSAERVPVPAILEYIPYGKREGTRLRDEPMHHYFAGHGYAAVRVDLRGTGDSEGVLLDEYSERELADGLEVIAWIASQPWCSGAVGMIGKSWGGFNALQLAARRPAALRGVISVCASDDRYADDAHYMGGCLLVENFRWGAVLFALVAHPPDPELVGPGWRELWRERLERAEPYAARWLRHPLRDEYWKHGSVCEDWAQITCPVYAISGWEDGYSNAVPRLLAGLPGRSKGLVGPWGHLYPHNGRPGPAIGFLQEALRWWNACLRGEDDGVFDEPRYRVWMQHAAPARERPAPSSGRWVAEQVWPSPRTKPSRWVLGAEGLGAHAGASVARTLPADALVGRGAGAWCSFGDASELAGDQREDDARSLCFDSAPLVERLEILGAPTVELELAVDQSEAVLVARLVDLGLDGEAGLVSYGVANLTHSPDHERSTPLVPGARRTARVVLNDVAHSFAPGHRLRLALSTSYWPIVWPSPRPVALTVYAGAGALELPERPPSPADATLRPFEAAESAPAPRIVDLQPGGARRRFELDATKGEHVSTVSFDLDERGQPIFSRVESIDLEAAYGGHETLALAPHDPLGASAALRLLAELRRGDWRVRIEAETRVTCTADEFRLEAELRTWEGEYPAFERRWDERVPRRGI